MINLLNPGFLLIYTVLGVGSIFLCYYAAKSEERAARRNGVHVKSKHRHVAVASELLPCTPTSPVNNQVDPYSYFFPYSNDCVPPKIATEKKISGPSAVKDKAA